MTHVDEIILVLADDVSTIFTPVWTEHMRFLFRRLLGAVVTLHLVLKRELVVSFSLGGPCLSRLFVKG